MSGFEFQINIMVFLSSIRRLAHIVFVIIRHTLAHIFGIVAKRLLWLENILKLNRLTGPQRLRIMLEDMGGTFIKFGQMLALQPDILSLAYCNELFNLLDRVKPFDFGEVERIFIEEFGKKPEEIFDCIEREPLATASIGQVHIAYIAGRKCAVKVQRPMVEIDFAGDIRLMSATIRLIKVFRLRVFYWLIEPISEFVMWTKEELDYTCEARYMDHLRRNAVSNLYERVPEVLWNFTTRRTLVMEFFEGVTLLSYLRALETDNEILQRRLTANGFDPNVTAQNIINNFLGDVFQYGIFHADLHPANLMILPDNVIGYVDFGITGTISRYSRQNLIVLTLAYTQGDLEGMCEAFFKVSVIENENSIERFKRGLKKISASWYEIEGSERRLRKNFTLVMLDMLRLSRSAGVYPARDVIKYIRSAIAIDGLITRFAPAFDIGHHLAEVCINQMSRHKYQTFIAANNFINWASSITGLIQNGPFVMERLLGETIGDLNSRNNSIDADFKQYENLHRKLRHLSFIAVIILMWLNLTTGQEQIGANIFTAVWLLLGVTAVSLLRTKWQLAAKF